MFVQVSPRQLSTRRDWQPVLFLAGVLIILFCVPALQAQFRGSIRGVVSDPSGSVVPGATVTLKNSETNEKQTSISDPSGIYNFNALPPGRFQITAEKSGFQKQIVDNYQIIPEQPNSLNLQMKLGEASQTVTVNGSEAASLDTETASLSGTISTNQIQHLPSYNRDIFQLAQLAPGVFGDAAQSSGGGTSANPGNQGPGGSEQFIRRHLRCRKWPPDPGARRAV